MKKLILSLSIIAASTAAIIGLCSFKSTEQHEHAATEICVHTHASAQGKHCTGSVGCDCSGFAPITNGKEWQKSYCKHCGHSKSCHK